MTRVRDRKNWRHANMTVLVTYEVRVAERDGTIRAHEFVNQDVAVRFAEFQ